MLIPVKGQAMVEVVSTGVSHLCDNSTVSVKVHSTGKQNSGATDQLINQLIVASTNVVQS